jgi:hypothetical protein
MAGSILFDGAMWLLRVYIAFYGGIALLIALGPIADLLQRLWSAVVGELSVGRPVDGYGRHSRRYVLVPVQTRNRR